MTPQDTIEDVEERRHKIRTRTLVHYSTVHNIIHALGKITIAGIRLFSAKLVQD